MNPNLPQGRGLPPPPLRTTRMCKHYKGKVRQDYGLPPLQRTRPDCNTTEEVESEQFFSDDYISFAGMLAAGILLGTTYIYYFF